MTVKKNRIKKNSQNLVGEISRYEFLKILPESAHGYDMIRHKTFGVWKICWKYPIKLIFYKKSKKNFKAFTHFYSKSGVYGYVWIVLCSYVRKIALRIVYIQSNCWLYLTMFILWAVQSGHYLELCGNITLILHQIF